MKARAYRSNRVPTLRARLVQVIPQPTFHEHHCPCVVGVHVVWLDRRMPAAKVWAADVRAGLKAGRDVHDRTIVQLSDSAVQHS